MRRALFALSALLLLAAPARADDAEICAEAAARYKEMFGRDAASEPVVTVMMFKYRFCPFEITVKKGAKIRYVNIDRRTSHSVWLRDAGKAESDRVFSGEVVELDADVAAGAHEVLCGPHWERESMRARLIIVGD